MQSVGTLLKFILKLNSELNVFNLCGSVFQAEDPEKQSAYLKKVDTGAR